ncbi:protein artichoke [Microplitis mediator]|uniref:protein artichoke n=1 Tax=Microplitis mediator TaxID=375433 RepID=UPI0025529182|nr:protein artichoke [Microplitis mediator]XP_057328600.1 protein artichoke [Microplitis mediator]
MGTTSEGRRQGLCLILLLVFIVKIVKSQNDYGCPSQEKILPCRCSMRDMEYQIWCSHSELPKVLEGLKAVSHYISHPVDELILENNNLPSLPGKVFTNLRVLRLMLRNNHLERVSSGWLDGLHDSLLELFIVEPDLRSLPIDSLDNLLGLEAITIQSRSMKRLPRFSSLTKLRYLQVNSPTLLELLPVNFRDLPNLEQLHIFGSPKLMRLEAGLFKNLPKLALINITSCGIIWIHPRAFVDLPELREISFEDNKIPDAAIVGRAMMELPVLSVIRLNSNKITRLQEEAFINLPSLSRLYLTGNFITEIFSGAFQMLPVLRVLDLNYNLINRIHPDFFVQRTGSTLEELWIMGNRLNHVNELRAILEALPRLKFLDASYNQFDEIPFGALRGHPTLERLHLDHNRLTFLQRETFSAMPALRELRLKNNSLTNLLEAPFWNLPGLKGLDLSENYFRHVEPILLENLPNLRRLDLSGNGIGMLEPESFLNVPALEHLNLSHNAISIIHPMTMRHLTGLYELDIGWNRLIEMVPGLPKNIEHLHLPMNRIVMLPSLETQDLALPALRSLDLNANGIERIIPGTLSELPSLRKLNLGYNAIRLIEDGTFDGLSRLEQLDLKYNHIMSLHGRSFKPLRILMDLSLKGNRLEVIRPDIFADNVQLQRLDLAINNLAQIPHATFSNTRDLKELHVSYNTLTELPGSLHGLTSLEVLDLSFNKLNTLSSDTLSSLTSLLELKLVRNKIKELREGAFNRLPRLSFIDLENNDLRVIERNAIKNLPELQAIRLGKNRIQMIPTGAFTDLPLLQSAEMQDNRIQEIAINAFINVPNLLLLNLSYNLLPSLEHAGISNLRSLEVLDLSHNRLTRVSSENLATLEWLVELKMDHNRICGIQGSPFDNMPRLRVLSMRSNRMSSISENVFKRLRSNIAVLDIDGNPLSCSCGMIWLRGWLQQSSSEGPRCADGSLFRDIRLSRQDCLKKKHTEPIHPGCETEFIDQSLLPSYYGEGKPPPAWMNTNNPSKLTQNPDYYYDDYPDNEHNMTQNPINKLSNDKTYSTIMSHIKTGPIKFVQTTTAMSPKPPNGNLTKKKNPLPPSPSSSGFTFFGVPLPNLNLNLWGSGKKSQRKDDPRPGRSRYRTYPPSEPEMHRGFTPFPETQGGFKPIVDPQIIFERKKNNTIGNAATITRVYQVPSKKNDDDKNDNSNNNSSNKKQKNDEVYKIKNDASALPSATDPRRVLSSSLKNDSTTTETSSPPTTLAAVINTSTTAYSNIELNDDSDEYVFLDGKTASRIVWTTPAADTTRAIEDNSTAFTSTEKNYQTEQDVFWNSEDPASIPKPTRTTPMSTEVTSDFTSPTSQDLSTDMMETTLKTHISSQTSRALEPSALSAFLIPGGQVPASNPVFSIKPSGRSTIVKVMAPLGSESSRSGKTKLINDTSETDKLTNLETVKKPSRNNLKIRNDDDDPFNWYYQNYNETNLEPYVGEAYNCSTIVYLSYFLIVLQLYISLVCY